MKKNLILSPFFRRPVLTVAQELVGTLLDWSGVSGRIVETEAYSSMNDAACHTVTRKRARAFFETHPPGSAYVYLNYGVHRLLNFSTEYEEERGFVLIRALHPVTGISVMQQRRGSQKIEALCSGPGKLCQALGIQLKDDGTHLDANKFAIFERDEEMEFEPIYADRRIGITKSVDLEWRFLMNTPFVSRPPSSIARLVEAQKKPTDGSRL